MDDIKKWYQMPRHTNTIATVKQSNHHNHQLPLACERSLANRVNQYMEDENINTGIAMFVYFITLNFIFATFATDKPTLADDVGDGDYGETLVWLLWTSIHGLFPPHILLDWKGVPSSYHGLQRAGAVSRRGVKQSISKYSVPKAGRLGL